jgi:hypothetical protein
VASDHNRQWADGLYHMAAALLRECSILQGCGGPVLGQVCSILCNCIASHHCLPPPLTPHSSTRSVRPAVHCSSIVAGLALQVLSFPLALLLVLPAPPSTGSPLPVPWVLGQPSPAQPSPSVACQSTRTINHGAGELISCPSVRPSVSLSLSLPHKHAHRHTHTHKTQHLTSLHRGSGG